MTEDLNKMQDGMGEKVVNNQHHHNALIWFYRNFEDWDALPFHSDRHRRVRLPIHTGGESPLEILAELQLARAISLFAHFYSFPLRQNWLLSLVLLTVVPAMAVMGGIIGKIMTAAAKDEMDIYGKVS